MERDALLVLEVSVHPLRFVCYIFDRMGMIAQIGLSQASFVETKNVSSGNFIDGICLYDLVCCGAILRQDMIMPRVLLFSCHVLGHDGIVSKKYS